MRSLGLLLGRQDVVGHTLPITCDVESWDVDVSAAWHAVAHVKSRGVVARDAVCSLQPVLQLERQASGTCCLMLV
jgi:hypothetical protein